MSSPSSTSKDNAAIPSEEVMAAIAKFSVFDGEGKSIPFGTIYESQRTTVVFIRHFFCGICQAYVEGLSKVRQDALDLVGGKIVVVGCGEWSLINNYKETTGFKGPVFADPSRQIYRKLGLMSNLATTPKGEKKKSYIPENIVASTIRSTWETLRHPLVAVRFGQGNVTQLGGDFVMGPGNTCDFAWRMRNTHDHVEIAELMKAAGIEYP